jgi:hypothetical protein
MFKKISLVGLLLISGCADTPAPNAIYGKLLVPEDQFNYQYAVVSNNSPAVYSVLESEGHKLQQLSYYLYQKGFKVSNKPVDIQDVVANHPGKILALECDDAEIAHHLKIQAARFTGYYSCGLYDLWDGKKVYEGEAAIDRQLFTNYDDAQMNAMHYTLSALPQLNDGKGEFVKAADFLSMTHHK